MNPETGEIRRFNTPEEARAAGFTVPLTEERAARLKKLTQMPRAERRRLMKEANRGKKRADRRQRRRKAA